MKIKLSLLLIVFIFGSAHNIFCMYAQKSQESSQQYSKRLDRILDFKSELDNAILADNTKKIQEYLNQGLNLNDYYSSYFLYYVSWHNAINILKLLLELGIKPKSPLSANAINGIKGTIRQNNVKCMQLLLENGLELTSKIINEAQKLQGKDYKEMNELLEGHIQDMMMAAAIANAASGAHCIVM